MTDKTNGVGPMNRRQALMLGAGALATSLTTAITLPTGRAMAGNVGTP